MGPWEIFAVVEAGPIAGEGYIGLMAASQFCSEGPSLKFRGMAHLKDMDACFKGIHSFEGVVITYKNAQVLSKDQLQ